RGGYVDRGDAVPRADLVDDVHARRDLPEVVVHPVGGEERRVAERDEELRAADAGRAGRHAGGAPRPPRRVALVGKLVGRTAGAVAQRVAALDDEAWHHPVEREAVVVVLLCEDDEVVDRLGGDLRLDEGDHEISPRGVHGGGVLLGRVDRLCGRRGSFSHLETSSVYRVGSRAPIAIRAASPIASTALTPSAVETPAVAATPPAIRGPKKKPSATELAFRPNTVL